jgi:hypothetical protein
VRGVKLMKLWAYCKSDSMKKGEVLIAVKRLILVFWVVIYCGVASPLKVEAEFCFKTLLSV